MPRIAVAGFVAAALVLTTAPPAIADPDIASRAQAFHAMAALDHRAQTVGWRLARGNARFCSRAVPTIGLLLQDSQSWEDPEAARAAFATDTDITVGAVADDSPAARAGLAAGQAVLAIDHRAMADLPAAAAGDYRRLASLHDRMETALARDGTLAIRITERGEARSLTVPGELACAGRFELVSEGTSAEADGQRVLVSARMAATMADEDQFAFVVAHELAHNLLEHPQMLKERGRIWGRVRHTEREADRLAVWLMANAGYDSAGAERFMRGWARSRDAGFLDPTHDAWDERLDGIAEERALIAASTARVGGYDWSARFPLSRKAARPAR